MFEKSREILEQVPQILQEINLIDEQMKRFLNDTDLDKVLEDLDRYIEVQPAREMVKDLIRADGKLKRDITIFHQVATETTILCEALDFLLDFLRKSVDLCRHMEFVMHIKSAASQITAEVAKLDIEEHIKRLEVFVGDPTQSQTKKYNIKEMILFEGMPIDELMKKICYSQNGIDYILLRGLRKIHLIRERIELIKCNS